MTTHGKIFNYGNFKFLLKTDRYSLKEAIEKVQPKCGWLGESFTSIHQNHKEWWKNTGMNQLLNTMSKIHYK